MGDTKECPDCGGAMEPGFIPDATHGVVAQSPIMQSHWHRGVAKKAKFLGLEAGVKVSLSALFPIEAYRCTKCWLVRSYAPPRPPRKSKG